MALTHLDAGTRLDYALATGDISGGVAALTDWIDSRCAVAAYEEVLRQMKES